MNKRKTIFTCILLIIVGSLLNFYFTNMLLNGVSNVATSSFLIKLLPGLSGFMIAIEFVVAFIFVARIYLHPTHIKSMTLLYSIYFVCLSTIGLITIILAGLFTYKSFVVNNPFPGFIIIFIIYHCLCLFFALFTIFYLRKKITVPDIKLDSTGPSYVVRTIIICIVFYIVMNRFGAFLLSPIYIQWRTLHNTYPFYISLILPLAIVIVDGIYVFNLSKFNSKGGVVASAFCLFLSVATTAQIIIRGYNDPTFLSAISPALPIDRLAALPIEINANAILVIALSIYTLTHTVYLVTTKDVPLPKINFRKVKKHSSNKKY